MSGNSGGKKQRTYLKIKAWFKCSKPECEHKWTSFHAWKQAEKIVCEKCNGKAYLKKFLDENCELDNYYCDNCDNKHWQKIHTGKPDQCSTCEEKVDPQGTQTRHGRHFWYVCCQDDCKHSWEGFSDRQQRTQRCVECGSRGDVVHTQKVPYHQRKLQDSDDNPKSKSREMEGRKFGPHNWQFCDMCRDLKGQGKGEKCIPYRKVECQVVKLDDGLFTERITKCTYYQLPEILKIKKILDYKYYK